MEAKTEFVLEDFSPGDRMYRMYRNKPSFGTVRKVSSTSTPTNILCELDTGAAAVFAFPDESNGILGKVLPLATVKAGDVISHLDFSGKRIFYTVIEHLPSEKMIIEPHDGRKPVVTVYRDYATASLEDEFMDWELEG
jgi:hypothetical protein